MGGGWFALADVFEHSSNSFYELTVSSGSANWTNLTKTFAGYPAAPSALGRLTATRKNLYMHGGFSTAGWTLSLGNLGYIFRS